MQEKTDEAYASHHFILLQFHCRTIRFVNFTELLVTWAKNLHRGCVIGARATQIQQPETRQGGKGYVRKEKQRKGEEKK